MVVYIVKLVQVMEWMKRRNINFSFTDYALYIDLLGKSKGVAETESFFDGLEQKNKNQYTYGALLNCYCRKSKAEKALELFNKMDELKMISNSLAYNNLMTMYLKLGQPEKVSPLLEQMKQKNITVCSYSYTLWIQSCAGLNDMDGVKRVLEEINEKGEDRLGWRFYSTLASIYIKADAYEKAEIALKKVEESKPAEREAYHYLISLYANMSNIGEVKRIWNVLKSILKPLNMSYLVLLQALLKLDDIDGLKEVFCEWKSLGTSYDRRLAYPVLRAYLKRDMYDEAVSVFDEAKKKYKGPFAKIRESFMLYYLRTRQLDLALSEMGAAISEGKKWKPMEETVHAFFRFFMEEKDTNGAEEFWKTLKSLNCLDSDAYCNLMRTYLAAGKMAPEMRQRLEEDGVEMNTEIEDLLAKVSLE